jgi:secretion/DNA translocation related TadE-like protein
MLVALTVVSSSVLVQQRVATAADLASLAGAQTLIDGQGLAAACEAAADVAQLGGASLTVCRQSGLDGLAVTCSIAVDLPVIGRRAANASATAGPP